MSGPEKIVFLETFGGRQMSLDRAEKLWPMFSRDERRKTHKVYDTLVEKASAERVKQLKDFAVTFNQEHKSKCFRCGANIVENQDVCGTCDPSNFGGTKP